MIRKTMLMLADPVSFRAAVKIDTARGVRPLASVLDGWQDRDFLALDNLWRTAAGLATDPKRPTFLRSWQQRPRGHSKSSDVALMVCWCLAAAPTMRTGILAAVDRDQGRILIRAISSIVSANNWLRELLHVQSGAVVNRITGSIATVLSCDVASSWGLLLDFAVVDEITHMPSDGMWISILSTMAKKERSTLSVIGNSGVIGSWQESVYKHVRKDPEWFNSSLNGPRASWSKKQLLKLKGVMPRIQYDRYVGNRWVLAEDSAINPDHVERATRLKGPLRGGELIQKKFTMLAGFDAATRKDKCALVCMGVEHGCGEVVLAWAKSWKAPRGGEIDLTAVEQEILRCRDAYGLAGGVYFDPSGPASYIAQRARRRGVRMVPVPFTPANLMSMGKHLLAAFELDQVALFPHDELTGDLMRLQVQELGAGVRLVAPRTRDSHCDLGIAFSICIEHALAIAQSNSAGKTYRDRSTGMSVQPEGERFGISVGSRRYGHRHPAAPWVLRPRGDDDDRNRQPFRSRDI